MARLPEEIHLTAQPLAYARGSDRSRDRRGAVAVCGGNFTLTHLIGRLLLLLICAAAAWGQPLPLNCGQGQLVSFTSASSSVKLNFAGQPGDVVLIRLTPSGQGSFLPSVTLFDPFGNTIQPRNPDISPIDVIGNPNSRVGYHYALFGEGTYTVQVFTTKPESTVPVIVSFVRVNRPCTNATLNCGRSSSGSIPAASTGQIDSYQFPAKTGDVISFRLLRVSSGGPVDTSTGFYLAVYGPDGNVLNSITGNRLPYVQTGGSQTVTAPLDGPLTAIVWESSGLKGGLYYISATRLNGGCGGAALSCSSALEGQLTTPLSLASYTLPAAAGDVYQFRLGRTATSGNFSVAAEIYDPQGNRVGLVTPGSVSGHAASAGTIKLPTSGSYSVLVSGPADSSTGGFTIASTRINRPCADATIACSAILDGSLAGVVRNRVYSLTASANDTFLIRLLQPDPTSLLKPRVDILDSAGNALNFLPAASIGRVNFTAPADGTYTLLVSDGYDNSQSGNYALSAQRLNRPCDATALNCAAVATGTLARSLSSGVYTWNAAAGESFSVRMLGGTGGVLPSIEVYDPQGAAAGTPFNGASSGTDVFQPVAGPYTVVALDNNATPSAGSYSIELLRTKNACTAPLAQAQTASGVVSATAPFAAYTMTASAGDTLALRSASSTPGFAAQMELYDPDGRRLDSAVFGLNRGITASGTYTVIVGSAAARTAGGFALTWQLMNHPAGTVPLQCGGTIAGSLAGANQFRYYTATAAAGDTLRMLFTRIDTFSPQVELFNPDGVRITANSDVLQKVTAAGDYLVMVSPSTTAAETGSYTLAFQRPNNPCSPTALTCGQTALKQVLVPGQLDTFTFTGTGGDLEAIRLVGRSGAYSPMVEMYTPAGVRTTSTTGQIRSVLPADGTYTLLVRDRSGLNLGSYRVSVQDETNTCPVDDHEAPAITLQRPTGGEVLTGGTTFRIQWVSDDNVGVATHDISLSTDGGKTFDTAIAAGVNGNSQSYDWILPQSITPTRTAMVRITATDAAGNAQSATSDLLTLIGSGFNPSTSGTLTYDPLNRLTQVTLTDGRTLVFVWDPAGNLLQVSVSGQ